jgi:effector-binding domain-containing protein
MAPSIYSFLAVVCCASCAAPELALDGGSGIGGAGASARASQRLFDPTEALAINWKQRVDEPYLYVEHHGDYRAIGASFGRLLGACEAAGIGICGPMFALYYDDPGRVATGALLARACVPVGPEVAPRGILRFDVLPSEPVAYAVVPGAYAGVSRSYPQLLDYVRERGWQVAGPIRETYLNPEAIASGGDLVTEVQVPWSPAP